MANILVVGKYYLPFEGGTETYTRDVCEMLARSHDVTAVVYNHRTGNKEEIIDGVRVIRCSPQFTWKGQPIALSMWKATDLSTIDLVHFHAPNFFANALLLLRLWRKDVPVVITHHMEVYGRRLLRMAVIPLYRRLARRSKAVIVTSKKNANLSVDLPPEARTIDIPLGIDLAPFVLSSQEKLDAFDWKVKLIGNARAVGFVGRHVRYKGLDNLVRAVAQLNNTHALIAGDGPFQKQARELAVDLGIADRVHFLGRLSSENKKKLLAASDVFAFPSTEITEAFGISLLEAMATGVPVAASDLPTGVTDIAIDGVTALLSRAGDIAGLKSNIERLLTDRSLADQLSRNALQHVSQNFTKERMLNRTRQVIENSLGKSKISTNSKETSRGYKAERSGLFGAQ